jgi:hypothetical protein
MQVQRIRNAALLAVQSKCPRFQQPSPVLALLIAALLD